MHVQQLLFLQSYLAIKKYTSSLTMAHDRQSPDENAIVR